MRVSIMISGSNIGHLSKNTLTLQEIKEFSPDFIIIQMRFITNILQLQLLCNVRELVVAVEDQSRVLVLHGHHPGPPV